MVAPNGQAVHKEPILQRLGTKESAFKKYSRFFVGADGFGAFLKYELAHVFLRPMPGALGLFLRKTFYRGLFRNLGSGSAFGENVVLRHPNKISIGDRVAIDDGCLLDGRDSPNGLTIGSDVLIARNTIIQCKGGDISLADGVSIGSQVQLSSPGGIIVGKYVMIAGQSYIGGGRYRTDDMSTPIKDQQMYTHGPVVIEDDVWIAAGVIVQDGVRIGKGSVIGAGAVIKEDVPEFTVVVPHVRMVMLPREKG